MRSPVVAMLWENWRVTRVEAVQRLVQGILLTAAVLVGAAAFGSIGRDPVRWALFLLVMTYVPLWMSVARLNGGRFMDGYRPGYPFYFLYTRPVRTFVLVGAPMAYNVASVAVLYVVSALILRATFGYPFPLLPLAVWLVAAHIAQWAVQWGTRSKAVQWVGSIVAITGFTALALWRARDWPARFDLPLTDYALLASIGAVSFGLAVAGVARQRRGDTQAAIPRTITRSGFSDWLAGLFRFPCPTSSATRAQLWFDLRSSGVAVLTIGLVLAILIPLLFVVGGLIDASLSGFYARPFAVVVALMSLPAVLLLGGNAFGIRSRQGYRHASVFEATLPNGTAPIAGLKVSVRAVCLLIAFVAMAASLWTSASVIPFDVLDDHDRFVEAKRSPLSAVMRGIRSALGAMRMNELLALAVVAVIGVGVMVALRAAVPALRARYPRGMKAATWLLLLHGLALVLLVLAAQRGIASAGVVATILTASKWAVASTLVLATCFVAWRAFRERLLTLRAACVGVFVSAVSGAAWVTVLHLGGVQLAEEPATDAVWILLPVLLPPVAFVLAPWSLGRVRHR